MKHLAGILVFILLSILGWGQSNCDSLLSLKYEFEGNVFDDSGNGHDGSLRGSAITNGFLETPRDNQSALVIPVAAINGAVDFTLSFRLYFDEFNRNPTINGWPPNNTIISGWSVVNNAFNFSYQEWTNRMSVGFDGTVFEFNLFFPLQERTWYCMSILRKDNIMRIYIDGVQVNADEIVSNNPVNLLPSGFVVGQDQDCLSGCFEANHSMNGRLDNFRIYTRALAVQELELFCIKQPVDVTICEGEIHEGYSATGSYEDTYVDINGCDSIRLLNLTVLETERTNLMASICEGEDFEGYAMSGIYLDTFPAITGCDSVRTLDLTVLETIRTDLVTSICDGDNFEGYTLSGIYPDTMSAFNGCDSIRTLNLTVLENPSSYWVQDICEGKDFEGYQASGIYLDTFPAFNGCDSIRTLELTVIPIDRTNVVSSICEGENFEGYTNSGVFVDTLTSQFGCDSIRTLDLTVLEIPRTDLLASICDGEEYEGYSLSGIYPDTFLAYNGCDSIRTLDLTVLDVMRSNVEATICKGENYKGYTSTGIYIDTFLAQNGCDSIETIDLSVITSMSYREVRSICHGESYKGYEETGIFVDTIFVVNNCDSINTLELSVQSVFIPNAFSPNEDGMNDEFQVYANEEDYRLISCQIYNRWGALVYEENDLRLNDSANWWDGTSNGNELETGVYVYYMELECMGRTIVLKGDVALVR